MFILWRYIIKEHIGPFLFGLSIITLVFLLNIIFRELGRILSRGLGITIIAEFFFLNLAWIIALAVPMAVLIATLMAFGRLSGDGEITAMKAGGVSVLNIMTPVFLASVIMAFFLVWFNNNVLPDANYRTKLLTADIFRKRPTLNIEPGVMYNDIDDYSILVQEIVEKSDTSYVKNIDIEDKSDPGTSTFIHAKRGKIFLDQMSGMLYLILFDGYMHELDLDKMEQYSTIDFPRQTVSISVPDMVLTRTEEGYRGDREKSSSMMLAEVNANKIDITDRRLRAGKLVRDYFLKYLPEDDRCATSQKRSTFISGKNANQNIYEFERIRSDNIRLLNQLKSELSSMKALDRENWRLLVEIHKKYSIPFACIVFILIGAPLGIMARRGSLAVAGGIAFAFFLLYWASLIGGEELADNQYITPFWAMWLANILCGAGGIYLIFHSIHEATFIHWDRLNDLIKIFLFRRKLT
ncbi:LptF/LptG family permease [candidate division KSB1 bacterium]|nr:LptF/LptG family permease [candidate division KSB1 bacterium]RQW06088.1 MAG: LptF/LptG family permease [candidate division KSB1 bacterium]